MIIIQISVNYFKNAHYYNNKLIETNEVIYMITDRIIDNDTIKKNFVVYEKIYLDKING